MGRLRGRWADWVGPGHRPRLPPSEDNLREDDMSDQPGTGPERDRDTGTQAGKEAKAGEHVRTDGEAAVDEAEGATDNPH